MRTTAVVVGPAAAVGPFMLGSVFGPNGDFFWPHALAGTGFGVVVESVAWT